MKKNIVVLIVFTFIVGLITAYPVFAEGPCPINYTIKIKTGDEYPILEFEFINTSIYNILEAKIAMNFHSADGGLLKEGAVVTISNLNTPGYYAHDTRNYYIKSYKDLAYVSDLECQKVVFADNVEWINNKYSDPKASFSCLNSTVDNKYKLDDGILKFSDTSLNSYSQKWFYWDDTKNDWSQFGNSVTANLETDLAAVTVKLEINDNPNIYDVESINLFQTYVAVISYATEEVKHSNKIFEFEISNSNGPYMFGFWDFNDSAESRKWYNWDDESLSWQFISDERGPSFLLATQNACLKLEYNNDPFNYKIIEISTASK